MRLTLDYLKEFCLKFESRRELFRLTPKQINLHGYEQPPNSSVMLDVTEESGLPQNLLIFRNDDNDDNRQWELDPAKRSTLIRLEGHSKVGYVFDGLLSDADARLWFRRLFGLEGLDEPALPPPAEDGAAEILPPERTDP